MRRKKIAISQKCSAQGESFRPFSSSEPLLRFADIGPHSIFCGRLSEARACVPRCWVFLQGFGDTINRPSPQSVRPSPGGLGTRRPPKPIPPFFSIPHLSECKKALYIQVVFLLQPTFSPNTQMLARQITNYRIFVIASLHRHKLEGAFSFSSSR